MTTDPRLLEAHLKIAVRALIALAGYNDETANQHLSVTGSYSCFDEPRAVKRARAALDDLGVEVTIELPEGGAKTD